MLSSSTHAPPNTSHQVNISSLYLNRIGGTSVDQLEYPQLRRYFLFAIRDFKSGEIDIDQLAAIASEAWSPPTSTDTPEIANLKSTLYACSELSFYLRKMFDIESAKTTFIQFFTETMQYYQDNKHLI